MKLLTQEVIDGVLSARRRDDGELREVPREAGGCGGRHLLRTHCRVRGLSRAAVNGRAWA